MESYARWCRSYRNAISNSNSGVDWLAAAAILIGKDSNHPTMPTVPSVIATHPEFSISVSKDLLTSHKRSIKKVEEKALSICLGNDPDIDVAWRRVQLAKSAVEAPLPDNSSTIDLEVQQKAVDEYYAAVVAVEDFVERSRAVMFDLAQAHEELLPIDQELCNAVLSSCYDFRGKLTKRLDGAESSKLSPAKSRGDSIGDRRANGGSRVLHDLPKHGGDSSGFLGLALHEGEKRLTRAGRKEEVSSLTKHQWGVLNTLHKSGRTYCSVEDLKEAWDDPELVSGHSVAVMISKMNPKLESLGIFIANKKETGRRLEEGKRPRKRRAKKSHKNSK